MDDTRYADFGFLCGSKKSNKSSTPSFNRGKIIKNLVLCRFHLKLTFFHLCELRAKPLKNNIPMGLKILSDIQLTMRISQLHTNY